MIILVLAALGLAGGTTWLVLNQSIASDPARHYRLSRAGVIACGLVCVALLAAALFAALAAVPTMF